MSSCLLQHLPPGGRVDLVLLEYAVNDSPRPQEDWAVGAALLSAPDHLISQSTHCYSLRRPTTINIRQVEWALGAAALGH